MSNHERKIAWLGKLYKIVLDTEKLYFGSKDITGRREKKSHNRMGLLHNNALCAKMPVPFP